MKEAIERSCQSDQALREDALHEAYAERRSISCSGRTFPLLSGKSQRVVYLRRNSSERFFVASMVSATRVDHLPHRKSGKRCDHDGLRSHITPHSPLVVSSWRTPWNKRHKGWREKRHRFTWEETAWERTALGDMFLSTTYLDADGARK